MVVAKAKLDCDPTRIDIERFDGLYVVLRGSDADGGRRDPDWQTIRPV